MKNVNFFEKVADPQTNTVHTCVKALLEAFDGDPYKARCAVSFSAAIIVADSKQVEASDMPKDCKAVILGVKLGDIKYLHQVASYLKKLERDKDKANGIEDAEIGNDNPFKDLI